jgi:hypothetical protein
MSRQVGVFVFDFAEPRCYCPSSQDRQVIAASCYVETGTSSASWSRRPFLRPSMPSSAPVNRPPAPTLQGNRLPPWLAAWHLHHALGAASSCIVHASPEDVANHYAHASSEIAANHQCYQGQDEHSASQVLSNRLHVRFSLLSTARGRHPVLGRLLLEKSL